MWLALIFENSDTNYLVITLLRVKLKKLNNSFVIIDAVA